MNDRQEPKKKNGRGSVNNASRLQALAGGSSENKGSADWGRADPRWVAAVVSASTLLGMSVSFTLSRDGGAHGLTLYDRGERTALWFNGDADLDMELEKVFAFLETLQ